MNKTQAEGGIPVSGDAPSPAGPEHHFAGAQPHHEINGEADVNFNAIAPIRFRPDKDKFAGWVLKPGID